MRRIHALVVTSALIVPTAALAAPVEAADATTTATIKNCTKSRHGLAVRIKMRDNGRFTRIRISHPRGTDDFREPLVHHVSGLLQWSGTPPPGPDGTAISGAALEPRARMKPSFRSISVSNGYSAVSVAAKFVLDNGKAIRLSCTLR